MIPTTKALNHWMLHVIGQERLEPDPSIKRITEAVELNAQPETIISTFGGKEFDAAIGFIDMRHFSSLAKGKTPKEVRDIAVPFVESTIRTAAKHHCIIDKTIGDEVMLIMPAFPRDVLDADIGLKKRENPLFGIDVFVIDLIEQLERQPDRILFTASFAVGNVLLDRIGSPEYSEWTCYGNVVNAAKRLQEVWCEEHDQSKACETHRLVVGCVNESGGQNWPEQLRWWSERLSDCSRMQLVHSPLDQRPFKGVGSLIYLKGYPSRRNSE